MFLTSIIFWICVVVWTLHFTGLIILNTYTLRLHRITLLPSSPLRHRDTSLSHNRPIVLIPKLRATPCQPDQSNQTFDRMLEQPQSSTPPATSDIEVRITTPQDPECINLVARQREEILLSNPDVGPNTVEIPIYIVLTRAGKALACGGLRQISQNVKSVAEIKRVYVAPEVRGKAHGVADLLLKQLELVALGEGWTTLRAQTARNMTAANRFYERHGFELVANYGEYVDCRVTISYEKVLA